MALLQQTFKQESLLFLNKKVLKRLCGFATYFSYCKSCA